MYMFFFFQAEDGIRDHCVTGVQTCALPIYLRSGDGIWRRGFPQIIWGVNTFQRSPKRWLPKAAIHFAHLEVAFECASRLSLVTCTTTAGRAVFNLESSRGGAAPRPFHFWKVYIPTATRFFDLTHPLTPQ